jgi:signal transduction histidine kinase
VRSLRQMAPPAPGRWPKSAWVAIDCGFAAVLALLLAGWVGQTRASAMPGVSGTVGDILALAAAAGVAVRRLAPVPSLAVVLAASVASSYLGFGKDPMVAVALVLYIVATSAPPGIAVTALVVAEMGVLVTWHSPAYVPNLLPRIAATAIVQLAAWTVGFAVRTQRRYAAGLREQAERRVQAEADRSRRALAEQRLRIARELHDVVAHSMGVIAVQAGAGGHVAGSRPDEAGKALRVIEETSRSALQELRRMLTVLRDDTSARSDAAPYLMPAPGLRDLPGLIDRTRSAVLRVELSEGGEPGRLAEGVDVAAFRIVQEALANVVRHAHADHACIRLEHRSHGLRITVTDNGIGAPGPQAPPEGHGLQGMRERVAICGGDFSAGPRPDGGYQIHAFLPAFPAAAADGADGEAP